jgi:hypothetical protein
MEIKTKYPKRRKVSVSQLKGHKRHTKRRLDRKGRRGLTEFQTDLFWSQKTDISQDPWLGVDGWIFAVTK